MSQQTTGVPVVRIADPGELLASIPQLLGFHPEESVVLIGYQSLDDRHVGPVLRCDLPSPPHRREVAAMMVERFRQVGVEAAMAVVIGKLKRRTRSGLPHAVLVRELRRELKKSGIERRDELWTPSIEAGSPWRCYQHLDCNGVLPDPKSTVMAATAARFGLVTVGSRQELARQFQLDPAEQLAERSLLIDDLVDDLEGTRGVPLDLSVTAVRNALRAMEAGAVQFDDDELADLALALCDSRVRDACLATAWPPMSPRALTASNLWLYLARSLPAPERAEAASLAGYAAYLRGEGPTAGIAFDVALEANPAHVLAKLLKRALECGMDPQVIRQLGDHDEIKLWPAAA